MPFVYLAEPVRCANRDCRETLRTVERVFMRADGSVLCVNCCADGLSDAADHVEDEVVIFEPEPEPEPEPAKPRRRRRKTSKKIAK